VHRAIVSMLATAREPLGKDPQLVASMMQSAMTGVSRRLLESASPEREYEPLRQELALMMRVYLDACLSKN